MNFLGLTDWFEIFRTGTWTDAAGNTREWTEQDLDTIAANYNPSEHEAPLVIGHPDMNSPAWGWVEGVKRLGGVLYAKGKQVVQEFEDMVKQGMFKNRSVRLSPDGTRLLHVGFLGAAAPAVKGLENVNFNEGGHTMNYEFSTESDPGMELHNRAMGIMRERRKVNYYGFEERYSYSESLSIAQAENPELTKKYIELLFLG